MKIELVVVTSNVVSVIIPNDSRFISNVSDKYALEKIKKLLK